WRTDSEKAAESLFKHSNDIMGMINVWVRKINVLGQKKPFHSCFAFPPNGFDPWTWPGAVTRSFIGYKKNPTGFLQLESQIGVMPQNHLNSYSSSSTYLG
ncbi:hypothetical protein XENORESO_017029, partial [Xenotaenia resolanae]